MVKTWNAENVPLPRPRGTVQKGAPPRKHARKRNIPNPKRMSPKIADPIKGITDPVLRRLMRRGGVTRISNNMYQMSRDLLQIFLNNVLTVALEFTENRRVKTVSFEDVQLALKLVMGKKTYATPHVYGR